MAKKIVLTGASGALGRAIAPMLAARGHALLLTDIAPFPDPLPPGAEFRRIDLCDKQAMLAMATEAGGVVHLGATAVERPFEEVFEPNIRGVYHAFEVARLARVRMVFASSNHAIGFHQVSERLDEDCHLRPDTFYGLSKAYGELMARLYWDKHGVESLSLRIGSCFLEPTVERHLSTWLSFADLAGIVHTALTATTLGCRVAWGVSDNPRSRWNSHALDDLGFRPRDSAERYAAQAEGRGIGDAVADRYHGGPYPAMDYTRETPSPDDLFGWLKKGG